jgi:selenide, water dikinase
MPEHSVKELVLVGGGHSHAIAMHMFGMHPIPGMRLTLISEASDTPYTGMLPGYVAGFYNHDQCYIDLRSLAQFAGAKLYVDRVVGVDLEQQKIICANRLPVDFDLLSLDIGSTPTVPHLPTTNSLDYSIPAKPIRHLLERWDRLLAEIQTNPPTSVRLVIVGGGVGGIELLLAMQHRLESLIDPSRTQLEFHLIHRNAQLLPGHSTWVQQRIQRILIERGVHLHLNQNVIDVDVIDRDSCLLRCQSGFSLVCDRIIWVTQAAAPEWLRASGLAVDAQGFILVGDSLQSASHPQVFAAGDIATMVNHPRPKAGVFAVRQGKPLFHNLRNVLLGEPLEVYIPQKRYLNLIGTADGSAIASRGCFAWESRLLWHWKDRIDRTFMQQFRELPNYPNNS